jgi:hypothetical protein
LNISVVNCKIDGVAGSKMTLMAAQRWLGPWFVGLFLIAQIVGVVPLISSHTAHVVETELVISKDNVGTGGIPQSHHHHGDADGLIQHHELQDLNGAFTYLVTCEIAFVHVAITAYAPNTLAEAYPTLLERPPKHLLSI